MAGSTRDIKRKIKSIKSTRQITRAMELVAAAKMKKATDAAIAMRSYASTALLILTHCAQHTEENLHPLLHKRPVKKALAVVFSSDRGLCGGFNSGLFRKVVEWERSMYVRHPGVEIDYIALGKRGQEFLARGKKRIQAAFSSMTNGPSLENIAPIGKFVLDSYGDETYDEVVLIYQHFISALSQHPTAYQLLPFSKEVLLEMGAELNLFKDFLGSDQELSEGTESEYLFEPSPEGVLSVLLPQLTTMQIFQALQETTASEHSARMVAMRSATENATEFIDDLTLYLNQLRQAAITQEIAEISAGKIALGM